MRYPFKVAGWVILFCLFASAASASSPITVGPTTVTNEYPESVTFQVQASTTAGMITSVQFNRMVRGGSSTHFEPAEFTPAQQVTATYVWDTFREGIPPGTPVEYTWTVGDEAGNTYTTEPEEYVVLDSRFTWQSLQDDDIALWWYAGDEQFGQRIFDSATQSLQAMRTHTGQSMPFRIHIVLYGDEADFDAWHNYVREWVGGEAYSATGLTVQIVPPGDSRRVERWIQQVIPHEIAHLFFYQVTNTAVGTRPPTWLNEGFAQYYEFAPGDDDLAWVRRVAERGELKPLRLLSGTFSGDDAEIGLMYAESLSTVTFLFERWGDEGIGKLLSAYQAGLSTDEALIEATGLDFEGFQQAWWEWLGGQPGAYPTRAARAIPTMPPLNTPRSLASPAPTRTPTVPPLQTQDTTPEPGSVEPSTTSPPTANPPTALPLPSEAPTLPPSTTETAENSCCGVPCLGPIGILGFAIVLVGTKDRAKQSA